MIRNRSTIGRNSAGPRPAARTLSAADIIAERERIMRQRIMRQPSSPDKVKALARIRCQLRSIENRVERHG